MCFVHDSARSGYDENIRHALKEGYIDEWLEEKVEYISSFITGGPHGGTFFRMRNDIETLENHEKAVLRRFLSECFRNPHALTLPVDAMDLPTARQLSDAGILWPTDQTFTNFFTPSSLMRCIISKRE